MIKTDIVAYVSSYALEGELIVPSAVLTSTPQEEEINLTYTPNFQLKLMDKNSYVVDDAWMSFSYSDTNYTAYMDVVNRTQDGIVTLQYNNGLTSEEMPTPEPPQPEPTPPRFTSPVDGDLITGTIDTVLQEFTYPIELEYGDGTSIPYDITSQHVTCDNSDITIGHTDDVDGDGQSHISSVYMSINQGIGVGTATLTYANPDTGDTCTVTFNYDITEAAHVPDPTILTSASIRTLKGDNETGDPCSYPDPESDNPTITIDENLEMSFDTSPSIICYNSTDGTNNYIKFEAGNFTLTALGNDIAQVIVTLDPSFNNDTSHLDVQPNADNQLVFAEVLDMTFSLGVGSTPLYITQIEVSYMA